MSAYFVQFIMEKTDNGKFPFYTFNNLAQQPGLLHFVSSGEKNVGFTETTGIATIVENRRSLAEAVGFDLLRLTVGRQTHSSNIRIVEKEYIGCGGTTLETAFPETDALITNEKEVCLMILTADCVPVLLYDPEKQVIAAIHAGWRGSVAGITAKTITSMQNTYGCSPRSILAAIAPSIGPCCFEVGEEVVQIFRENSSDVRGIVSDGKQKGKYNIDLWETNRRQLLTAGVLSANMEVARLCTFCHPGQFFSYRHSGTFAGRFGTGILLRDPGSNVCK